MIDVQFLGCSEGFTRVVAMQLLGYSERLLGCLM